MSTEISPANIATDGHRTFAVGGRKVMRVTWWAVDFMSRCAIRLDMLGEDLAPLPSMTFHLGLDCGRKRIDISSLEPHEGVRVATFDLVATSRYKAMLGATLPLGPSAFFSGLIGMVSIADPDGEEPVQPPPPPPPPPRGEPWACAHLTDDDGPNSVLEA